MRRTEDIRLKASMIAARDDWSTWARAERTMAIQQRRFQDVIDLEADMIEESGLERQLALAIKDKRWVDCIRLSALIDLQTPNVPDQMTQPNLPHPPIEMAQSRSSTTFGLALEIADDTILGKGESSGFRLPPGPTLVLSADPIRAAHKMLGAAAAPAAGKQDNVGNEVHDNMCKGKTSGYDYDMDDGMSNEADKLKTPFADEDVMGGWTNFGQLSAWGHGTGGGDTWDPNSYTIYFIQGLSHTFACYFFPECTVGSS